VPGHVFTHSYAQPPQYRFCQDSVIFSWLVAQICKKQIEPERFRALDIGAGCGVLGFELVSYLPQISHFDFIEVQDAFAGYFTQNLQITGRRPETFRFLNKNYDCLSTPEFTECYDLIIANPPYFFVSDGKPAKSELRHRCRFFADSTLEKLLLGVGAALKPGGEAFLLIKPGRPHGRSVLQDVQEFAQKHDLFFQICADIRGTAAVQLSKALAKPR
jgi:tRNA1Val (adenine37-N6)-methyltransferase